MHRVAQHLERQCRIIATCDALSESTEALADFAASPEALDLWRLPIVIETLRATALLEAEALNRWTEAASEQDALLARDLRELATLLSTAAARAARVCDRAREFAESESFDSELDAAAAR